MKKSCRESCTGCNSVPCEDTKPVSKSQAKRLAIQRNGASYIAAKDTYRNIQVHLMQVIANGVPLQELLVEEYNEALRGYEKELEKIRKELCK